VARHEAAREARAAPRPPGTRRARSTGRATDRARRVQQTDPPEGSHPRRISVDRAYPMSAWQPALLTNLGIVYRRTGYYSRALVAWEQAWSQSKGETEARRRRSRTGRSGSWRS
jgi:hypothetical protein